MSYSSYRKPFKTVGKMRWSNSSTGLEPRCEWEYTRQPGSCPAAKLKIRDEVENFQKDQLSLPLLHTMSQRLSVWGPLLFASAAGKRYSSSAHRSHHAKYNHASAIRPLGA